ncbi:cilia- and flagella-associated protein 157 [Cochliomyia hominivorax]
MSAEESEAKGKKGGKGKGKKGKKADPNKLNQVDKTFYELTITDLNQKLSRLRSHLASLDDTNNTLKEKLRSLEEDRIDVAAHLEKTLAERDDTIKELEERLVEITKVRNNEKQQAAEHIKDLENKYKSMHDQLTSEIKLLNGKLNSLDEFRIQRDVLLAKFDDQEQQLKEKDRSHQETIYNIEQKAVVEKDALKKEVEAKLLQVSEDFTRSSEIRNAGYTRRLIRENIALQKEIDILVISQLKMQQDFKNHMQKNQEMKDQYNTLDQLKNQLIKSSQNKIRIIEKLTTNYERLKAKYSELVKYRSLYENITKRDVCDQFSYNEMTKKLRVLGQRIETLKLEKNHLIALHEHHEAEIQRLQSIIQQIKLTVQIAIKAIEEEKQKETIESDESALRQLKRHNLLTELMELVSSHSERLPETPSIQTISRSPSSLYRPGKMGFMPRTASSLMEIFKREAQKLTSTEAMAPDQQIEHKDSRIIPKERISEAGSIIDVEMGSTLIVSSSHEDLEVVQMEEEPDDMGEEGSSSDFTSVPADTADQMVTTQDESRKTMTSKRGTTADEEAAGVSGEQVKKVQDPDAVSRSSRVSRMSKMKSLPGIDTDEYSINVLY